MMRHDLPEGKWHKSSYSTDNGGQCLEKQTTAEGDIACGDSKNRLLGAHTFAPSVWQEFVSAVRNGSL